jgi:thiamine kinase-like enzyme
MRLVKKHLPDLPVPSIHATRYRFDAGVPFYGELEMDFMPGRTLISVWSELDERTKDRVCHDIWNLMSTIRASVPRPADLPPGRYRTVDGSSSRDPLLGDNMDIAPTEFDDDVLRDRIYARYVAHNGLSYKDGKDLRNLLPRSDISVFTHGDLVPRNIMVDEQYRITAVLDWESSGWFPDYWEYAQMMKPCHPSEREWQEWMTKTRPEPWDITGIQKARRVLF